MAFARDLRATPADLSARADADVLRAGLVGVDVMRVAVPQRTTFRELVRGVDAVFIATPEYNSSVPGALKNALDCASRPLATNVFRNKPVAVISSSAGAFGGVWAAAELRKVLGAMGARVTDVELSVGHASAVVSDDVRESLRAGLDLLLAEVAPVFAAV